MIKTRHYTEYVKERIFDGGRCHRAVEISEGEGMNEVDHFIGDIAAQNPKPKVDAIEVEDWSIFQQRGSRCRCNATCGLKMYSRQSPRTGRLEP